MDIDTSNMDLDKLLKLGIAFNINTGDDVYDNAKIEARKGLNKLINANNSLAIMDYLEALPFMSYSGKAMRDFAKNQARKVYGTNMMRTAIEEESKPVLQAASDVITRKAVKRFVEKGDIAKALATKHIGDYLVKGAALSARQAFLEGTEEGIQEILQNRYQRGLYDDDQSQYSLFDINEVFNDAGLAAEAFAAYLGYDPWDTELPIDQVRKAMNIGAVSSILFSKALSGSRNILSGDIEGSIRDLHSQLKNDKALANIISNFYDKVQDQHHL